MNFTIHRDPLLDALQKMQYVVEKRNTVPILGNILCSVSGRELSLCATDLEVGIKIVLPVESKKDGKITLSAKHFLDIVKELPSKDLVIGKTENGWVEIVCGKSKFKVVSLPAEEYPSLPSFEDKAYFEAKAEALIDMIDRTQFAVSTDATRYHLNGVYFEPIQNGLMRMTSTDGHRLSFVDTELFLKGPELKRGVIIPKKGLSELRKLLSEAGTSVGLAFERGYVFGKLGTTYLFIRLIDGEYPDVRGVIPKQIEQTVRMSREEFNSALKRVSLLANEKSKGVKLAIDSGVLTISSSNQEMGEAREEIDIEFKGEPVEIGFNSKYLLECLSVLSSEKLEFCFKDRLSPGILQGGEEKNHTYVIMPMRI
jgi:DNA polymerase III subunit beta